MPRGMKVRNEYVEQLGRDFALTPKSVFAAIAFSLAMRLTCDDFSKARQLLFNEWNDLKTAGIVRQTPLHKKIDSEI